MMEKEKVEDLFFGMTAEEQNKIMDEFWDIEKKIRNDKLKELLELKYLKGGFVE